MARQETSRFGLRRTRRVSTVGVAGLAVAGFVMSYGALHALARDSGVPATLAWLWPLVVDGFIVVASLSVVHAVLEARAAYPWALLLLFSAVSVAGNVAHGAPTPVGRLVAAVPPVALVLAFDLLMRQVRRVLEPAPDTTIHAGRATPRDGEPAAVRRSSDSADQGVSSLRLARPTVAGRAARVVAHRRAAGGRGHRFLASTGARRF